uniref:Reverse transcriptase domain-containing protein n=1 Tax=Macrostomum lignano TaxID=282301 RepID=A0A1I8FQP5_9PLAT
HRSMENPDDKYKILIAATFRAVQRRAPGHRLRLLQALWCFSADFTYTAGLRTAGRGAWAAFWACVSSVRAGQLQAQVQALRPGGNRKTCRTEQCLQQAAYLTKIMNATAPIRAMISTNTRAAIMTKCCLMITGFGLHLRVLNKTDHGGLGNYLLGRSLDTASVDLMFRTHQDIYKRFVKEVAELLIRGDRKMNVPIRPQVVETFASDVLYDKISGQYQGGNVSSEVYMDKLNTLLTPDEEQQHSGITTVPVSNSTRGIRDIPLANTLFEHLRKAARDGIDKSVGWTTITKRLAKQRRYSKSVGYQTERLVVGLSSERVHQRVTCLRDSLRELLEYYEQDAAGRLCLRRKREQKIKDLLKNSVNWTAVEIGAIKSARRAFDVHKNDVDSTHVRLPVYDNTRGADVLHLYAQVSCD